MNRLYDKYRNLNALNNQIRTLTVIWPHLFFRPQFYQETRLKVLQWKLINNLFILTLESYKISNIHNLLYNYFFDFHVIKTILKYDHVALL